MTIEWCSHDEEFRLETTQERNLAPPTCCRSEAAWHLLIIDRNVGLFLVPRAMRNVMRQSLARKNMFVVA